MIYWMFKSAKLPILKNNTINTTIANLEILNTKKKPI